MVHHSNTFEI